jgi:outer membrane protein TolC
MPAAQADPIAAALAPHPGGLTPDQVAQIVARNKHSVRAKLAELKAAAAKVDQAFVNFFPRLSLGLTYTRLSPIPPISFGPDNLVVDTKPPPIGTVNGQPLSPVGSFTNLGSVPLSFVIPLNSTALTASLVVPVSDYVFRISQGYASASHNQNSLRLSAEAEALQASADARIAYLNWVRAKGAVVVADEAVDQAKAHVEDAKKSFAVGLASRADVLRIEAQVAAAQQAQADSVALSDVAEEQLRTLIDVPADRALQVGADVMHEPPKPPAAPLPALEQQAMERRLEIRALDETIYSLKQAQSVTEAGYLPRIDAFADATYADPNQRIFPATDSWNGTWDLGVRLSWTLNDTFTTAGAASEAKAQLENVKEQQAVLRDGLRMEVASAYADAAKVPTTIEAAERGMVSAEESLRVRRELFRNGKATSSELVDAEAELTQARMRRLDAHINVLVTRTRLDHATGADVPPGSAGHKQD